jgi:hypothetical protein
MRLPHRSDVGLLHRILGTHPVTEHLHGQSEQGRTMPFQGRTQATGVALPGGLHELGINIAEHFTSSGCAPNRNSSTGSTGGPGSRAAAPHQGGQAMRIEHQRQL